MNTLEILTELASTKSTNSKIEILNKHKDDTTLQRAFYLAYNPYINFFTRKLPSPRSHDSSISLDKAFDELKKIYTRQLTGNRQRTELIKDTMERLSSDDSEVLGRVILKNLKCGCSSTTYNKINDVIPSFPRYLAQPYNEKNAARLVAPYIVQLKSDGSRCCALVKEDNIEYKTREGNEYIIDVPKINEVLWEIRRSVGTDIMVDGEMIYTDKNGVCDRLKSNGIVNKAIKGTITEEEQNNLAYYIWDCVPLEDFFNKKENTSYVERFERLMCVSEYKLSNGSAVEVSPTNIVETLEEVDKLGRYYLDMGEEGVVVKSHNGIWEDKRSYDMQKIKNEYDCDLIVVGYKHGDANKNMNEGIGSLICESADGTLKVSVSSGLSMADRGYVKKEDNTFVYDKIFDLNMYTGSIVKITYNSKIKNKDKVGFYSLFTPRFIAVRGDKLEADLEKDIK